VSTTTLTVPTKSGEVDVEGEVLGRATTHRDEHNHPPDTVPEPGQDVRCSACRWTEVTILDDVAADKYVVVVVGRSIVEGESQRGRVEVTDSPTWVVECLRRPVGGSTKLGLPTPARRALAEAADLDPEVAAAYHAAEK